MIIAARNTSRRKSIGNITTTIKRLRKKIPTCRTVVTLSFAVAYIFAYVCLSSNSQLVVPLEETVYYKDESVYYKNETTIESLYELHVSEIRKTALPIARVYQPSHPSTWCVDSKLKLDQKKGQPMGLCYLKIPHAAGTTLKSINMRISRNFAQRFGSENCIRHDSNSMGLQYRERDKKSYLWTFLRDPTHRAMSVIGSKLSNEVLKSNSRDSFFHTSVLTPSINQILVNKTIDMLQHSTDIRNGVLSEGRGGFQLQFGMQKYIQVNDVINRSNPIEIRHHSRLVDHVVHMFRRYDFIGLVERFDESLVAMKLLLGLESSDILYFAASRKEAWQPARVGPNKRICRKPFNWETDLVTEPSIRDYVLESKEWYAQNYGDYLLYQAAVQSLDLTILEIGLETFSQELKKFRSLMQRAREECFPMFACSSNGTEQFDEAEYDCRVEGKYGCGYRCLDGITD